MIHNSFNEGDWNDDFHSSFHADEQMTAFVPESP